MAWELEDVDVREISSVSEPANKRRWLIMKSRKGTPMSHELVLNDPAHSILDQIDALYKRGTLSLAQSVQVQHALTSVEKQLDLTGDRTVEIPLEGAGTLVIRKASPAPVGDPETAAAQRLLKQRAAYTTRQLATNVTHIETARQSRAAYETVQARVTKRMAAAPALSPEEARAAVFREDPALYERYLSGQPSAHVTEPPAQAVYQKIMEKVSLQREVRPGASTAELISDVLRLHPELYAEYQRAQAGQ